MRTVLGAVVTGAILTVGSAGCSGSGGDDGGQAEIVVTTNVLGDVVTSLVGDLATVEVVMPPASNPHDFAPSARQAAAIREAQVLVVNGRGFEEGLVDTIESAEADGVAVVTATDGLRESAEDDDHATEDGAEHGHDHDADAHFFTDPVLMAEAVEHLAAELREHVPALDDERFDQQVEAYQAELDALHGEVTDLLAAVPEARRLLVTNHDVLGFFADRYGFRVLGVVIPGGSTLAEPSASDLDDLAAAIDDAGVPAIFAETSSPSRLAEALAAEGTDVEVVDLHTESLGEPGSGAATYLEMVRTNARRIAEALAG